MVDSNITFEQIIDLEWSGRYPIMFENVEGRLTLKPITNSTANLFSLENGSFPWSPYEAL